MLYFGLAAFLPLIWWTPWWSVFACSVLLGFLSDSKNSSLWILSFAGGLAWCALAFIKDGRNGGLISDRVAGMFSLPVGGLAFALVFLLGFITVGVAFQAGQALRRLTVWQRFSGSK